jgi:sugar phosphate isomerase/epimerase
MLQDCTRRDFLRFSTSALISAAGLMSSKTALASMKSFPVGMQLFAIRDLLTKDFGATLKQIAALGFEEVEAAGFLTLTAAQVKTAMKEAGLRCVSGHYPMQSWQTQLDANLKFASEAGLKYVVCSAPALKDPSRVAGLSRKAQQDAMTLEDWRWNASELNRIGEAANTVGLRLAYHNNTNEFRALDGVVPYDELLRLTEPRKVMFELDCGWALVGGADPVAYLKRNAGRIPMIHVKDFHSLTPPTEGGRLLAAEMGQGVMDNRPILEAALRTGVEHCFVEQEGFDMPPLESLKIDAEYMKKFSI